MFCDFDELLLPEDGGARATKFSSTSSPDAIILSYSHRHPINLVIPIFAPFIQ